MFFKSKDQSPETREEYRQDIEDKKERWILYRERLYTILAGCIIVILVLLAYVLFTWRDSNRMASATSSHLNSVLTKLEEKIDSVDTANLSKDVHENLVEVKNRVADLKNQQDALTNLTNTVNNEAIYFSRSFQARMDTLDSVLVSARNAIDEGNHQVKQNGDATKDILVSGNTFVKETTIGVTKLLSDGSLAITSTNTKTNKLLDDFDIVLVGDPKDPENSIKGLVKKSNRITDKGGDTMENIAGLTKDIRTKEQSILFPPPDKGFTGFMKKYILRPITTFGGAAYLVERLVYNLP